MFKFLKYWLLRRKWLYYTIGIGAFSFLIFELSVPNMTQETPPNYLEFEEKYGVIPNYIFGYVVDRFASGSNYMNVSIALLLIIYCLHLEKYRFEKTGKTFNFFGLFQSINQTFNENEKE